MEPCPTATYCSTSRAPDTPTRTPVIDIHSMPEAQLWALFRKYPGLLGHRFAPFASYVDGYDLGARRHSGRGLGEWRDWLRDMRGADCAYGWRGAVAHLAGLHCVDLQRLTAEQEDLLIRTALGLLERYATQTSAARPTVANAAAGSASRAGRPPASTSTTPTNAATTTRYSRENTDMTTPATTPPNPAEEVTVVTWNIERNGLDADGGRERRDLAMGLLEQLGPDILLRQEETKAVDNDGRLLREEADRLGLEAVLAPEDTDSTNPTAVLYRAGLFEMVGEPLIWNTAMWKTLRIPVLRMHGTTTPVAVASIHLCHFSPVLRQITAERLTTLADHGKSALIGGDFNSYPAFDAPETLPDWTTVTDSVHYQHRTVWMGESRVSDSEPDRILAGITPGGSAPFRELGRHAAVELNQSEALRPTATLWRNEEQGGPQRIDRLYATPNIAEALSSLFVIDSKPASIASDHACVVATFDKRKLERALTPAA
ncbi:endonuclease/exonuclease/phosphatase family protein [Streptomyces sp. NPDC127098]|uniref:endonuclease/exonuclease/phosphatase family protein n=1 Tax=Streptomyces sp. NPDC127098 TaxID=3347137 RepID=UPI0036498736